LLNQLLQPNTSTASGLPLHFVRQLPGASINYEQCIFDSGMVNTRADNVHDLCNALVWSRLPATKAAINHLHCRSRPARQAGVRGPLRDALTLLDESGLLVLSAHGSLLRALQQRDWHSAFVEQADLWRAHTHTLVCGHALLEKLLTPFKSITAKALLVKLPAGVAPGWPQVDATLAGQLLKRRWLQRPQDLSPLPLAGIPGWWQAGKQNRAFYADRVVFRPPPAGFRPAAVRRWP
jgi:hypothetical protein